MAQPLEVLPLDKAKEHLNREKIRQPGEDDELEEFIGAAVDRVSRHLGRPADPSRPLDVLAAKVVLAEYWKTQRPAAGRSSTYTGHVNPNADDGPTSGASIRVKLTDLLGPAAPDAGSAPQGLFPPPQAWPDPIQGLR
ncbi:head-tail connector protein [Pseudonocardia sp. NPDC049635]|uniref:head-tail connector protein n=1 Tax=Pseudonocardia sp. NPDC049635 TaxID=3155506 RepID=UPI0033D04804